MHNRKYSDTETQGMSELVSMHRTQRGHIKVSMKKQSTLLQFVLHQDEFTTLSRLTSQQQTRVTITDRREDS